LGVGRNEHVFENKKWWLTGMIFHARAAALIDSYSSLSWWVTLSAYSRAIGWQRKATSSMQIVRGPFGSRPAWIYEGALLFVTEICCTYEDSKYKRK
jgi:hypothetical protein